MTAGAGVSLPQPPGRGRNGGPAGGSSASRAGNKWPYLAPTWVKLAQVFPIGVGLGFLFRAYGVEGCMLAHAGINLVLVYLSPHLIVR